MEHVGNWILFLLFGNFFFSSVMLRIAHGMSSVTIGAQFQKGWAVATTCTLYGFVHFLCNHFRLHAIYRFAGHFITQTKFPNVSMVCGSCYGSSHCISVIFNTKNNRKLPKHGKVEGFVERTLTRCTVAHISQGYGIPIKIFICKSQTGTQGNLSAHNTVATIKTVLFGKNVHRTPQALRSSGSFSIEFCHYFFRIHAHTYWLHVVAVGGNHSVFCEVHCVQRTSQNCFLTVVKVQKAPYLLIDIYLSQFIFKLAPKEHILVPVQIRFLCYFLHLSAKMISKGNLLNG